jgi:hypothetical protein
VSAKPPTIETVRALLEAFGRLCDHDAWDGCQINLTRGRTGEFLVTAIPDWVDAAGMDEAVNISRELELSVALVEGAVRIEPHTAGIVRAVEGVKRTLAGERAPEEQEDDDDA